MMMVATAVATTTWKKTTSTVMSMGASTCAENHNPDITKSGPVWVVAQLKLKSDYRSANWEESRAGDSWRGEQIWTLSGYRHKDTKLKGSNAGQTKMARHYTLEPPPRLWFHLGVDPIDPNSDLGGLKNQQKQTRQSKSKQGNKRKRTLTMTATHREKEV